MSIFSGLKGFSFINENKGVIQVDVSGLDPSDMMYLADYLNQNNAAFRAVGENKLEVSMTGTGDEVMDMITKSRVGDKVTVAPVKVEDYGAQIIKGMNTRNFNNDEFKKLINKYRSDIDAQLATITSKIDAMDSKFDPYQLDEIRKMILEQGDYINDMKGKLELEAKNRQDMSDYISSMRKSIDDLNIKTNNQLVDIQRILDDRLNNLSAQIDEVMRKSDMSAVERDIRKIVTEFDSIKRNRDAKDKHVHELEKKIEALGKKVNTNSVDELVDNTKIANIAEDIENYNKSLQSNVDDISAQHMALVEQLEEIKEDNPKDYKTMMDGLNEITKTKIAVAKATGGKKEAKTTDNVDKADDDGKRLIDFGKNEHMTGNQYVHTIHLPLDKVVVLNDLEKIKVMNKEKGKKFDPELDSTMAKVSRGIRNLFGYDLDNEAAVAVAKYGHFRDATGSLVRWIFANPVALLTGIAGGTLGALVGKSEEGFRKGEVTAENIGDFIKYEMIQNTGELNPAVLNFEKWLRNKLHLGMSLKENFDSAASAPMGDGAVSSMPGTTFQTGASISGAGNPIAPTVDTEGSGDDFNPKRKKKKGAYKSRKKYVPFQVVDFATYINQGKK